MPSLKHNAQFLAKQNRNSQRLAPGGRGMSRGQSQTEMLTCLLGSRIGVWSIASKAG